MKLNETILLFKYSIVCLYKEEAKNKLKTEELSILEVLDVFEVDLKVIKMVKTVRINPAKVKDIVTKSEIVSKRFEKSIFKISIMQYFLFNTYAEIIIIIPIK